MREKNRNHTLYLIYGALYVVLTTLSSGSIFQSFLLESGVEKDAVALFVSVSQVAQTSTMLLLSKAADAVKDVRKGIALTLSIFLPFFVTLLSASCAFGMAADVKHTILFTVSFLFNLVFGFYVVLSYKLPHHIMDIRDYGKITGVSGVISGVVGMMLSVAITFFLGRYDYFDTMSVFFGIGIVISVAVPVICMNFRMVETSIPTVPKQRINIFRYKPFYLLLLPNFMRGFSTGILSLITVIGYATGVLDSSTAAIVVMVTQVASLLSSQLYSIQVGKHPNGRILLVASIAFCVITPITAVPDTTWVFLIIYFFAYFLMNHITIAVPVLVANRIEYTCLGQYTAWRMALHTLGMALGGMCVPFLLDSIGAFGTLLVCGITMLPCGIGYHVFEKNIIQNK